MYLIFALFMSALAFISRGLTVSSSPSSAVYSSQVFVLGFVMAGRSFLPVGIEKGQSISSAVLLIRVFGLLRSAQ